MWLTYLYETCLLDLLVGCIQYIYFSYSNLSKKNIWKKKNWKGTFNHPLPQKGLYKWCNLSNLKRNCFC